MKKNKILYVATVDSHIKSFHLPYLKMMHDKGWEVHVATNGKEKFPYCDKKHTICMERSPFKPNNLKAIKQMKELLKKEHFDIIHCHTPMGSVVTRLAAKKSRKNGTRVIYTAHGFHFYTGAPLINWLLFYPVEWYLAKYTDTLITINHEDYNRAKKKFSKRCRDIQYVPGVGIDPKKFDFKMAKKEKHELRASLGLKDDDFVMIFPAELSKRKNQMWLIKTLEPLLKEHKEVHLLLPGRDSLNGKCQKLANKLNLEEQVHFPGFRSDIPKLLKISNLAVSSARQEGLPVNILESTACGLQTIALTCRGANEIIEKKNLSTKDSFCELVRKAMSDKKTQIKLQDRFRVDKILKKYENIANINRKQTMTFITSGYLPVPPTLGGAAEELVSTIIKENDKTKNAKINVFSVYEKNALKEAKNYSETNFIFFKPSIISKILDSFLFFIMDKLLRKDNSRRFRYVFQRISFLLKCGKELATKDYGDIIIENHTLLYIALKVKKNYKKYANRYYYHCHNIVPGYFGMKKIIQDTRKIISVSEYRNNYAKDFFNKNDKNCRTILNCYNEEIVQLPSASKTASFRQKYKIKQGTTTILYVGRIDKDKGTKEFLEAIQKSSSSKIKAIIAGAPIFAQKTSTSYENEVRKIATKLNNKIVFTGYISHNDINILYSISDIVVIPSQIDDSAPLVLLEAIACGKPIIATNCGGIPEYVENNAILIDRGNDYTSNLSRAIDTLITDKQLMAKMSNNSMRIAAKYTPKIYYKNFIQEIRSDNENKY